MVTLRGRTSLAALTCLVCAVIAGGCRLLPKEEVEDIPALIQPPEEDLVTHVLALGPIDDALSGSARVGSGREQELYFVISGRIHEVLVAYGDQVKKGQPLISLETGELAFQLRQASAALEQEKLRYQMQYGPEAESARAIRVAEIEVAQAELDLAQAEDRLKAESISCTAQQQRSLQRDVERARLALTRARMNRDKLKDENGSSNSPAQRIARLSVERAQIEYDRLAQQMEDSILRAPFAGKITDLNAERGQMIQAFAPLAKVSDMKGLEMISSLPSSDAYRLSPGIRVKVDMMQGPPRLGRVTRIQPPAVAQDRKQEEWLVRIKMDDPRFPLAFDDYYSVSFILRSAPRALLAPNDAVREDVNGRKYLRVIEGKRRRDVYIRTGIESPTHTQVLAGAKPGMVVIGK